MTIKSDLYAWYIARRIRLALGMSRAEWRTAMKPFPKWFGILSVLVAAGPAIWAAIQAKDWMTVLATLGGVLGLLNSHSMTGTGGQPQ